MTSLVRVSPPLQLHGQVSYVDTIDEVFAYNYYSHFNQLPRFNCSNEKFFLEGIADLLYSILVLYCS